MKSFYNSHYALTRALTVLLVLLAALSLGAGIVTAQDDGGEGEAVAGTGANAGDVVAPPVEATEPAEIIPIGALTENNLLLTVFGGTMAALALGALLLALGAWAYPKLKSEEQGYLYESEVEAVLLPLIHDAVHTVHEMTITRLRAVGGAELSAEHKQALFAELYRVIVPAELKRFVSLAQWQEWGQSVYDSGRTTVIDFADHLDRMLEEWEGEAA